MDKKRNGAIDFWRFVFAILLVIFHAYLLDEENAGQYPFILGRASMAVEFFLVTSGYLMAASVHKLSGKPFEWKEGWTFIKHKIGGFYPAFAISWAVSFILINIVKFDDLKTLAGNFFSSVFELTLIRNAGFNGYRVLNQTWYLSAMVIVMFALYPLYRINRKRFEYYIAPAAAILILGYVFFKTGSLNNPNLYMTYSFKSTYRAAGEICLGVICYVLCRKIRHRSFTKAQSHLLSLVELLGYGLVIYYMQCYDMYPKYFDFIALLLLSVSVTVSFSAKSSINPLFSSKVFTWLGKFSLYPYLMFMVFTKILPVMYPDMDMLTMEIVYIGLTLISALAVMLIEKPIVTGCKALMKLIVKPKAKEAAEGSAS